MVSILFMTVESIILLQSRAYKQAEEAFQLLIDLFGHVRKLLFFYLNSMLSLISLKEKLGRVFALVATAIANG